MTGAVTDILGRLCVWSAEKAGWLTFVDRSVVDSFFFQQQLFQKSAVLSELRLQQSELRNLEKQMKKLRQEADQHDEITLELQQLWVLEFELEAELQSQPPSLKFVRDQLVYLTRGLSEWKHRWTEVKGSEQEHDRALGRMWLKIEEVQILAIDMGGAMHKPVQSQSLLTMADEIQRNLWVAYELGSAAFLSPQALPILLSSLLRARFLSKSLSMRQQTDSRRYDSGVA